MMQSPRWVDRVHASESRREHPPYATHERLGVAPRSGFVQPFAQPDPTQRAGIWPAISFWAKYRPAVPGRLAQTLGIFKAPMQFIAPLIQTVLWVALIGAIVWRFNKPIHGLLFALQKRVESGSSIKAGPFELIGTLKPSDPEKQNEKVEAELNEAAQPEDGPATDAHASATPLPEKSRRARYFQAEDLALRAIQAEYRVPISRQITGGSDSGFDGVFAADGRLNIVEVKYLREVSTTPAILSSVTKLVQTIEQYNWPLVRLLLVVVFERVEDIAEAELRVLQAIPGVNMSVVVRVFALKDLQQRFGIGGSDA